MFREFINRYATTFTTTLFIVSAVSGVFLFFHTAQDIFKAMHEWLSMVLLLPVVFHIYKNWNSLITYFRRRTIYMPIAASLIASVAFAYATVGGQGGNPMMKVVRAIENAPIAEIAPLFDKAPEDMVTHLKSQGFDASSTEETLAALATRTGVPSRRLIGALADAR